jgi:hypothetical protein
MFRYFESFFNVHLAGELRIISETLKIPEDIEDTTDVCNSFLRMLNRFARYPAIVGLLFSIYSNNKPTFARIQSHIISSMEDQTAAIDSYSAKQNVASLKPSFLFLSRLIPPSGELTELETCLATRVIAFVNKVFEFAMNDDEFLVKLAEFIEDALPEVILQDRPIMQKVHAILRHEDPKQNLSLLSILRAWCRKMTVRIQLESDRRLRTGPYCDIPKAIGPSCASLAERTLPFFNVPELLPLACQTCADLLTVSNMPATQSIVQAAMNFLYINPMKIPLLTLVSRANFQVGELPLLDPVIARCFTDLHAKLSAIAPADKQAEIGQILQLVSRIEQINSGAADIDRDLLEYCDLTAVIARVDPSLAAGHPAASVRVAFYEFARQRKLPIVKYLDQLTCAGLFDLKTRDIAMELIASQLPSLAKGRLSHQNIAHLQCIPLRPDTPLFRTVCDAIEGADNFTEACSWVRFLYHREQPVREAAQDALRDIFRFRPTLDVSRQLRSDPYVESFLKKLRSPTKVQTSDLAESFFGTITSVDQPDFIKKVSAERLAELILDPFTDVHPILPEIRDLPFEAFPELTHAAAIRDGSWKIASVAKLFELVRALTEENSKHLLPVLSRTVFAPLVNIESDGADLLRLPAFVTERSMCWEALGAMNRRSTRRRRLSRSRRSSTNG